jgi:tetratricopeptide (TPR) repeat protein
MQEQLQATPKDARYQLFTGTFLDNINQYQMAIPYLQNAVALSPTKQTMMFELQKAYSYTGQYSQALAIAQKAYELDTDYTDAKLNYLAAAILNNDDALVSQLWGNATSTTNSTILQAYLIKASNYLQSGDKKSAIAEVQKDISIDPSFASQGNSIIQQINSGAIK